MLYNEGYTVFNRFHILFETTLGATEKTMGNLFDRPTQTNRSKKATRSLLKHKSASMLMSTAMQSKPYAA